jgi:hypothetical protein
MDSKKGQGISLNFIVIAIIAALVLIIVVSFTVGGLGAALGDIFRTGDDATKDSNIKIAEATCENLCNEAKSINKPSEWKSESYCSETHLIETELINCWAAPISVSCSTTGEDLYDAVWGCDESGCSESGCSELKCYDCKEAGVAVDCTDEATTYSKCMAQNGNWEQ